MVQVAVGLGSNIDRELNLRSATQSLRNLYPRIFFSPVFRSDAVGFDGPYFFNLVGVYDCAVTAHDALGQLHDIEDQLGRRRSAKRFGSRQIDIDLLLYGDSILYDQGMDIPRREILQYAHVLKPLSLALPDHSHPISGRSYRELWGAMSPNQKTLLEPVALRV